MNETIREFIGDFVRESPDNQFLDAGHPHFDEPIVAYAAAGDLINVNYFSGPATIKLPVSWVLL